MKIDFYIRAHQMNESGLCSQMLVTISDSTQLFQYHSRPTQHTHLCSQNGFNRPPLRHMRLSMSAQMLFVVLNLCSPRNVSNVLNVSDMLTVVHCNVHL